MSESELAKDLQRQANIDKIRMAHQKIKAADLIQRRRDSEDELQELNFDDDLMVDDD